MEENKNTASNINQDNPETECPKTEYAETECPKTEYAETGDFEAEAFVQAAQGGAAKPKKDWKKELREWVISIATALLVVFIIRTFFFEIIRVDGDSMNSTLLNGERLFVTVLDTKMGGAERGDVVICHYPNRGRTNFVKRVVAVEGDQVYRENGVTHVVYEMTGENGETFMVDEVLDENYALFYYGDGSDNYGPYTLGEDEYFVVGDNRYNSHDSRDWNDGRPNGDVGPITEDMLVGQVRYVIWPLNSIRVVE